MAEFWEDNFIEKQEMWGLEPSKSAVLTKDFFVENVVTNMLIPELDTAEMHKFLGKME